MSSVITSIAGRAIPLRGNDIDTDRIIPARFLRCVVFDGLGEHVFEDDRQQLTAKGETHAFDQQQFQGASILVVNGNFGCGSSREHAPQAIARWGVQAICGVSFSEIFYGNCVAMGLPCVHLTAADIEALQGAIEQDSTLEVAVDLQAERVSAGGKQYVLSMPAGPRRQFLTGSWDALGQLTEALPQARQTAARLPYLNAFQGAR